MTGYERCSKAFTCIEVVVVIVIILVVIALILPAGPGAGGLPGGDPEDSVYTHEPEDKVSDSGTYTVKVFYGTDRKQAGPVSRPAWPASRTWFLRGLGSGAAALILGAAAGLLARRSPKVQAAGYFLAFGFAVLCGSGWILAFLNYVWPRTGVVISSAGYGPDRSEHVQYGVCRVTIPRDHRMGKLESPSIFRLEFREDPKVHVVLREVRQVPSDDFFRLLKGVVRRQERAHGKKTALVFIHGFKTSFEDAARRTAQLAYDLKYEGAPIFWSWPSQGRFIDYPFDTNNAEWTEIHLAEFLRDVAKKSGADTLHVVAHSMGNRCVAGALVFLRPIGGIPPQIREVVLAAPDIDAGIFRSQIAPYIVGDPRRVTLYVSSNDRALAVSKQFNGLPRAGDSGDQILIYPPIDTIDVSSVDTSFDGHSYFANNDSVLSDIFYLLHDGKSPSGRFGIKEARDRRDHIYWKFEPHP